MARSRSTSRRRRQLADAYRRIQETPAQEAGTVGFLARPVVEVNLPYRSVHGTSFSRRAGRLTLTLLAPEEIGLPYGRYPRLFLLWLSTRAVRSQSRRVALDGSLSSCLRELGIHVAGGPHGTIRRFRNQVRRLLATTISVHWSTGDRRAGAAGEEGFRLARRSVLWWTRPAELEDGGHVELSRDFFSELLAGPVPLDLRAYRALSSALGLDVYAWLSYRLFGLGQAKMIAWRHLYEQFGTQTKRQRDFRRAFCRVLPDVLTVYPAARVRLGGDGVILLPSPPSVPRRP